MAIGDFDIYEDAGRLLRAVPEPGWEAIEPTVLAAIRATPRGGWPLAVQDPEPGGGVGVIRVSDLVLRSAVSRALGGDQDYVVTQIETASDGEVLQEVSTDISVRYQADVSAVAARVRARAESVVTDVVGPGFVVPVTVTVSDVHR